MPLIRQALAEFRRVTGLAALLVPVSLPRKPIRFGHQEISFCHQLWAFCEGGCLDCHRAQNELLRRLDGKLKPQSVCCAGGIVQLAVPVIVEGDHVATVIGGKVRLEPGTTAQFEAVAARLGLRLSKKKLVDLRHAYFAIPVLTPARFRQVVRLLDTLARLFGEAWVRRPVRTGEPDSTHISRAKTYVYQHLGEHLTTQQAARALNLSNSYFCRLFRRHTGMTFHGFLGQTRIEAAKSKLLSSMAPVTEICYVSGFQSISDFNRVFKAKVGTSPTKFRRAARPPPNAARFASRLPRR